jgi:hypothetical protein
MKILEYLKNNKLLHIIIALVTFTLFLSYIVSLRKEREILQKQIKVANYNQKVTQDSVRLLKDKAGKDEYNKLAFLTESVKSLTKLSEDLAKEVKQIKGTVSTLTKAEVKIVEKPVPFVVKTELNDSTVKAFFNYDTTYSEGNYKKLAGYTQYNLKDGTAVAHKLVDEMGISFTTGIKNVDKGQPEIFLKSDYPGFTVTNLNGAYIDPKLFKVSKTPLITPTLFIGYTPIGWTNKEQKVRLNTDQFSVGIGLGFNLLKISGIKK